MNQSRAENVKRGRPCREVRFSFGMAQLAVGKLRLTAAIRFGPSS